MANISDAFGTITIWVGATEPKEQQRLTNNFKKIFDEVMSGKTACYYTDISSWTIDKDDDGNGIVGVGDFNGCGRWAFEANCRYTYDWLKQGVENRPELKKLLDEINKYNWKISYEFADEEAGCEVLYEMNCDIDHRAGEDKAYQSIRYEEDFDYNAQNLVNLGFFDTLEEAEEYVS